MNSAPVALGPSSSQHDSFNRIIADLKASKTDEQRQRAATELRQCVSTFSREQSGEAFIKFMNDTNRRIFELIHSNDNGERLGGIVAIDLLLDFDGEENSTKITRFANYLRNVLPGNDPNVTIQAARTLGRLALCGGTLTSEFVEFEAKRALEWLQADRNESRRQAAVLVLKELAQNTPTLIYAYISQILDALWTGLRDQKPAIREGAGESVRACLHIIQQRNSTQKQQWYQKMVDEINKGFKIGSADAVHGSIIVASEMFERTGRFMDNEYQDICDQVLKYKDNRDPVVRRAVMLISPVLASYNPNVFVSTHLHQVMLYTMSQLKKDKDRSSAFVSIGKISISVGSSIGPYLDAIIQSIRDGLTAKGRNKQAQADIIPIFQCISMLSTAVGQALTKHMHELLEQMFATGLSDSLRIALIDVVEHIPPLLPSVQERLLHMLSFILSGQPYKPPGAPEKVFNSQVSTALREIQTTNIDMRDQESVLLALNTLATFNFSGHMLAEFIKDSVSVYLEDESVEIRRLAATTCCQALVKEISSQQTQLNYFENQLIAEVLEKILMAGIADPDASVRHAVLTSLTEHFDVFLAQAENIRSLFIALNDENFNVREASIVIIGRLTSYNPAYVMPSLRKTLIQLLTELEYSTISRNKEESAKLLSQLISAAQRLIKPYVEPILKVLMTKLKDPSPTVSARVLSAVGALAEVGQEDLLQFLPQLLPLIIETIQDQSSPTKREAALKTLGLLSMNSTYVIDPYVKYPQLLTVLMAILKSEQIYSIRKEAIKVLGILGALDPYHQKTASLMAEPNSPGLSKKDGIDDLTTGGPSQNEDYYPTVAIDALMRILKDSSLSVHHTAAVQAVMYIFKTLGLKCVSFLPIILPPLLNVMRACPSGILEFYFQQLGILVSIVKQHIRSYLDDILALTLEFWNPTSNIQITILTLIESIAIALDSEFKIYLPKLLPNILSMLDNDSNDKRQPTLKALHALSLFGGNLEEYLHLVLPALVKLSERPDAAVAVRKLAIQTIGQLSRTINFSDHASRIVHPLARTLQQPSVELRAVAMDTLCSMVYQLTSDFLVFVPMINKLISKNRIQHQGYEVLISKLLKNEALPQEFAVSTYESVDESNHSEVLAAVDPNTHKKLPVNQQHLKKSWETSQRSTKDDWAEWIRRLSVELLKESPSHALRACASLANVYYPLARELFNAAFVSCWTELYDQFQDELVRSMESALISPTIPPEVLQTLLNLAEFMEHDEKPLPINIKTLGGYAAKCHAYAKALHYKEMEFMNEPSPDTIEALISINNQLQQPDAAIGILTYTQRHYDLQLKESWYEKLERWEDALAAYEKRLQEDPGNLAYAIGRMRCFHALGCWEQLSQLAQEKWFGANDETRAIIAPLAAAAAWGLGQWESMQDYVSSMKLDSTDGVFFRAVLAIHRNHYAEAQLNIDKTRDLLDTELKALVGESYSRAYNVVVKVQLLAELNEIILYKKSYDMPEKQLVIRKTWMKRLKGCQRNVEVWQKILTVRSLVMSPVEDVDMWIKFANLCRKSGRPGTSLKILNNLLNGNSSNIDTLISRPPRVVYAYLKHIWNTGQKDDTFQALKDFTFHLCKATKILSKQNVFEEEDPKQIANRLEQQQLLARCYLKLGHWRSSLTDDAWDESAVQESLHDYYEATRLDPSSYKAWHSWAYANFEVSSTYEKMGDDEAAMRNVFRHVVPAIQGFFRSIALSSGSSLQDTLRLLTLLFKYGYDNDVFTTISDGLNTVSIDTWLHVIPQLIARIHSPNHNVRKLIHQLLSEIGKHHPQALIYSLTVASKSQSVSRKDAALTIMDKMRFYCPKLVEQALLVSQELIRVAILWHEMWHEGLEEASRLYFGEHDVEGMFTVLEPLHAMMERGPETLREVSFNQAFGRDLQEAQEWCEKYKQSKVENDLHQAWDLYYHVFRKINKQLPQLTTLELQYVSPKLMGAVDLELAVPGTYRSGEPVLRISSFAPTLTVITSKQRPRKLTINGSDGRSYQYLLKGHEDLRQDERVMQLFGLVNTLLASDPETLKRHLNIHRYPVIPLSPNSGLIGWVPHCDTLHSLIRDYRESKKILLNIEHRLMLQMAPDYDNLTLMQKVEVFQYALDQTTGQDLYKVLWLKSKNSEAWLDRRTNYTRSLAVMSMVGYILGLGDRHPSNLMLDQRTGKVIHIDFGDCFEVAMHRDKFPEKIPFRLTRMLVNAMEVSGIEGSFRTTCEDVMTVLRENKDSLMAVLEAFVHDPLINWRLFGNPSHSGAKGAGAIIDPDYADEGVVRNAPSSRKLLTNENELVTMSESQANRPEMFNAKAVAVIHRVNNKLTGRDFRPTSTLAVNQQVQKLIQQATAIENLCQCYIGWCPFW